MVPALTRGKAASKENVEELFGGDVRLEVSVEGAVVAVAGLPGRTRGYRLISILIVLLPLLRVAQHCVRVPYCCLGRRKERGRLVLIKAKTKVQKGFFFINLSQRLSLLFCSAHCE